MITTLIIIWLLIGLIALVRKFYSQKRYFWVNYRKDHKNTNMRNILLFCSPIFIMGGLVTLFLFETTSLYDKTVWYYKIDRGIEQ
jgi:uncharacterized membrane protein